MGRYYLPKEGLYKNDQKYEKILGMKSMIGKIKNSLEGLEDRVDKISQKTEDEEKVRDIKELLKYPIVS